MMNPSRMYLLIVCDMDRQLHNGCCGNGGFSECKTPDQPLAGASFFNLLEHTVKLHSYTILDALSS